jgi:serine/threonine protein phosphatase 1
MNATAPRFAEDVARQHRRVEPADWEDVYVVGDVHGCLDALERLLDELGVGPDDLVVFVGDLVRKGPHSAAVVEFVRAHGNLITVRGNNEEKIIRGDAAVPGLDADAVEWLHTLPAAISFDDALVVHGGVDPRKDLTEHSVEDLQNTRSLVPGGSYGDRPYWFEEHDGPHRVFFGHTVLEEPVVREHAVGLDTGCVYGGELTAYDYRRDEVLAVPLGREGVERADRKRISPPAPVR